MSLIDLRKIAGSKLTKKRTFDPQILRFIKKYGLSTGDVKIPNSVIYELYKHWHRMSGRKAHYIRMDRTKFFRRFKQVFRKQYRKNNQRGFYLSKEAFMPYFKFTGDKIHEQKIQDRKWITPL